VRGRWWHSGGSLKDLGRRVSRISEVENPKEIADMGELLTTLAIPTNAVTLP
jgi:hypothetical protein